jgi:hypothetical protein
MEMIRYNQRNTTTRKNRFYNADIKIVSKPITHPEPEHPSTAKLLGMALKKIFRLKSVGILFNYFLRKAGFDSQFNRLEEQTIKKLDSFFNQ